MLRAVVTPCTGAIGTLGVAHAHSDQSKETAEKEAAHDKHAASGDAKKGHDKEKHGSDHGKSERKHWMRTIYLALLAASLFAFGHAALAHGEKPHAKKEARPISTEETPFGREGDPKRAKRTVKVDMNDNMRFTPAELTIKQGEVVRFQVKNSGKVMHEMVLGTMDDLKKHAEMMKKHPEMEHDEPYMAHVGPGKTETMTWQFTKAGEFYYGCLVPGHFEAGMIGKVVVKP